MDLLFSLATWLAPVPVLALAAWLIVRQKEGGFSELSALIGKKWIIAFLSVLMIGTWIIPWGAIIPLLAGMLILHWVEFDEGSEKHRLIISSVAMIGIMIGGFVPTSIPSAPDSWGEPLLTENLNSPIYPNSEQHVWVLTSPEIAAVSVTTIRTPWAMNPIGGETALLWLVDSTGADKERLRASIEALNEESSSSFISPDLFELVDVESESTHRYKRGDIDQNMCVKRQQIVMDIDLPLITLKAEVLSIVDSEWGGQTTVLTIIRPGITETHDIWAEDVVLEWLQSRE